MINDIIFSKPPTYSKLSLELNSNEINILNYSSSQEFKNDILIFIKMLLYSSDYMKILQFIESKIPKFFKKYPMFKLFIYKLHLFHLIIHDKSYKNDNDIEQFYCNYIKPMIADKSNFNIIQNHLKVIVNNPVMITNRSYQSLWKEVCGLFEIGVELAIEHLIRKRNKHKKEMEMEIEKICKCNKNEKCKKCKEKELYQMNCNKIENFEFEVIKSYNNICNNNNNNNIVKEPLFDVMPQIENNKDVNTLSSESENEIENDVNMIDIQKETHLINSITSSKEGNENKVNTPHTFSLLKTNNCQDLSSSRSIESNESIEQLKLSFTGTIVHTSSKTSNISMTNSVHSNNNNIKKFKMKEFQFRFTKRENIDKYVLRKFRKFLKETYKLGHDTHIISILTKDKFWYDFIAINLLPPFIYPYEYIEFKSFNTTYMAWLFNHSNAIELYNIFIKTNMQCLLNYFVQKYKLASNDEEYISLQNYLNTMANTFCNNRRTSTESTLNTDTGVECVFDKVPNNNISKGGMMFNIFKCAGNEKEKGNKNECKMSELNCSMNQNYNQYEDNCQKILNNSDTVIDEDDSVEDYVITKEEIDLSMINAYRHFY